VPRLLRLCLHPENWVTSTVASGKLSVILWFFWAEEIMKAIDEHWPAGR
jgi:hypothetical protein